MSQVIVLVLVLGCPVLVNITGCKEVSHSLIVLATDNDNGIILCVKLIDQRN